MPRLMRQKRPEDQEKADSEAEIEAGAEDSEAEVEVDLAEAAEAMVVDEADFQEIEMTVAETPVALISRLQDWLKTAKKTSEDNFQCSNVCKLNSLVIHCKLIIGN